MIRSGIRRLPWRRWDYALLAAIPALLALNLGLVLRTYSETETSAPLPATLICTNNPFQGDVVFISSAGEAMEFRCDLEPIATPEGYRLSLPEYSWSVTSGEVDPEGSRCLWIKAAAGIQTITVEAQVRLEPTQAPGWFGKSLPERIVRYQGKRACLVPEHVDQIENGMIHNFKIGTYPNANDPRYIKDVQSITAQRVKMYPDAYTPPHLFYPVTPETFFVKIFKNYNLGEFDLDPRFLSLTYPRYVSIHPRILKKLDLLQKVMNDAGVPVTRFRLIYAFRSPAYNSTARFSDGDKTLKKVFSSHMYGLAVDMIVDEDDDLVMDDLNHDGQIDLKDAETLMHYVNILDRTLRDEKSDLVGGAGPYYHHDFYERGKIAQTPYVHMDARGFTAENGALIRWPAEDLIGVTKMKAPYRLKGKIPPYPFSPSPNESNLETASPPAPAGGLSQ